MPLRFFAFCLKNYPQRVGRETEKDDTIKLKI